MLVTRIPEHSIVRKSPNGPMGVLMKFQGNNKYRIWISSEKVINVNHTEDIIVVEERSVAVKARLRQLQEYERKNTPQVARI